MKGLKLVSVLLIFSAQFGSVGQVEAVIEASENNDRFSFGIELAQ